MSEVKKLAGQTIWYGMSSVASKLLNSLMTPLLTYVLVTPAEQREYGSIAIIYSYFALLNVIFTYGMETAYFRFCSLDKKNRTNIYNTAFGSLILSTIFFCIALFVYREPIEHFVELGGHVEYVTMGILILFFDTIQTIPFARLRQEQKPRKYALIRVLGIVINIVAVFFFLIVLPKIAASSPNGFWANIAQSYSKVTFVLFSNLLQSVFTFFALFQEWRGFRFNIDKALWRKMFQYSSPMVLIGMAYVANEMIDRQMLIKMVKGGYDHAQQVQAIYSANYKLSIVVTMFITAFRMAAEPFFFGKSEDKNAPILYAKVMKWFVITVCIAFLSTALFLDDIWSHYIGAAYRSGLYIVPILLMANVFNGIYYNLSTWYKVTDKMMLGVVITGLGALISIFGNYFFIPQYEMLASAWTTFTCYASMVVVCYFWGQRHFPVPYAVGRILLYLASIVALYFIQKYIGGQFTGHQYLFLRLASGLLLMGVFFIEVFVLEKKEMKAMPIIGKYIK